MRRTLIDSSSAQTLRNLFVRQVVANEAISGMLRIVDRDSQLGPYRVILVGRNGNGCKHANDIHIQQNSESGTEFARVRYESRKNICERIAARYLRLLVEWPM